MSERKLNIFNKYLTIWVVLSISIGTLIGYFFPTFADTIGKFEISNISIPITLVLLFMMYPIMLKINIKDIIKVKKDKKPLGLTLLINWGIKPFSTALIAWFFIRFVFSSFIPLGLQSEYIAGMILLGIAPCTAMVLVWTHLAGGNVNYALVQVSVNDIIILILFAPLGKLLLGITTNFPVPFYTILFSVLFYVGIPLILAGLTRYFLIKKYGKDWFHDIFINKVQWISPFGLLLTLVLLFIFQGDKIISYPIHIILIAIPLIIQTYFVFAVGYFGAKKLKIPYNEAAPSTFIGASDFFELAVGVAIILFGLNSGAALATVVGVLVEVPLMLSLVKIMKMKKSRFKF
ncbi:MAG: ACR3 family arsenite efflux transporter [Candidatus Aenigmatarchaeota archaeon]